MIGKYLYELLKANSRVIIPDFGAFLVKDKSGGKLEITFNDFLKFNDGLLVNKLIKTEGISKTEATDKINGFIQEIEEAFKKDERYVIESIGEFYKDETNRVKFEALKEIKLKETISTEEKKATAKEEPPKTTEPEKVKTDLKEDKASAKPEDKPKETVPPKPEQDKFKTPASPTAKEPIKKPETQKPTVKTNSNKTLLWVSAIIVVLAAIITWGVLDYDRISTWFNSNEKEVVQKKKGKEKEKPIIDQELEKEAKTDVKEEIVTEPVQEEVTVKEVKKEKPSAAGPKYYVVAGSFKVESNAIRLNKKLIDQGYRSENLGRINGFHIVTYDGFTSYQDALKLWRMEKASQPDSWILKY